MVTRICDVCSVMAAAGFPETSERDSNTGFFWVCATAQPLDRHPVAAATIMKPINDSPMHRLVTGMSPICARPPICRLPAPSPAHLTKKLPYRGDYC
jgi:hypothetical protein